MDVFNRPPAIAEETLHYSIYPPQDLCDKPSATSLAACIASYVESLLPGFIWHRDPFDLKVVSDPDSECDGWMLEGTMRVGDCVDDEWCVVWLLKEISARWDVAVSVYDSDGEFLLIEAAEVLPSWVKPTNTENRVWIYKSHLQLIPLQYVSPPAANSNKRRRSTRGARDSDQEGDTGENDEEFISVMDALRLVRAETMQTRAPEAVETTVWNRISGYPSATKLHIHKTKAFLPTDIGLTLSVNPSLVQKAVEAFYTRDAIQLRAAHRMSRFPPEPSVLTTVKLTRTAYAQLVGQKFYPPKVFGKWNVAEGSKEWRGRDVGMKIACGFEMLYQESKGRSDLSSHSAEVMQSSSSAKKDALRRDPNYAKYIHHLVSAGYFKGELEGSQLWNALEDKAVTAFIDAHREDDATRTSFAAQVAEAISRTKEAPPFMSQEEDSDEWLNVDAHDFDQMLERTVGNQGKAGADDMDVDGLEGEKGIDEDKLAKQQAAKLSDLAKKVESFVDGEGGLDAARFEDEPSSDEELTDQKMSDSDDEGGDDDESEGDEVADREARQAAMDKLVPGLAPSEYGQMPPSFHSNSQRVSRPTADVEVVPVHSTEESSTASMPTSPTRPIRPPIIMRDKYDGVDSDDETDSEDEREDEEAEDQPQVVGEVEIDMADEEEEFLEFSRQALGISDEHWGDIVSERKGRGVFVPASATVTNKSSTKAVASKEPSHSSRTPASGTRPNANPNLDSFEAVMQAMDVELARARKGKLFTSQDKGKGKAKATPDDDEQDIESMMDAELKATLEQGEGEEGGDLGGEAMDYGLIKNFLESLKSQAGLSGPVSNLAGRLQPGWSFPRDES